MSTLVDKEKPLTARVPKALKQRFGKHCFKLGESVRERILELVEEAVAKERLPENAETLPMKDLGVLFVYKTSDDLKARFKALCALHNVTLERAVAALMTKDMA